MDLEKQVSARKKIAVEISQKAGSLLVRNFDKIPKIRKKADRDFVSEFDIMSETLIINAIRKAFPKDGILSEESPQHKSSSGFIWIIDPVDGTHNYIRKIDIYGVSIALEYRGEVVLGVIYIPPTKELYFAQKNKGAYKNNKKIKVSKRKLIDSTVIYDSSIRYDSKKILKALDKVASRVFNVRMLGSTARSLTFVAEGKAEAEIEFVDKVWDYAAGLLMVEEAGGVALDLKGRAWNTKMQGYIATNREIAKDILKILRCKI